MFLMAQTFENIFNNSKLSILSLIKFQFCVLISLWLSIFLIIHESNRCKI